MGASFRATGAPLRRRLAAACLVLAVALLFHRVLLGEGLLYFRDVSLNHLPSRIYTTPLLRSGHLALWNPYLSGGMPFAANPNNLLLHPISLLFLALPVMVAFHASILLQYVLAGWGMLLWARGEGLREEAGLAGAVTYALGGAMASCGSLQNLLSSWAWVPLALFAAQRHRQSGSRWALLGFSGAVGVQVLAGDPLAAGTALLLALADARWGAGAEGKRFGRAAGRLAAGFLLGCGMALAQVIPAREMLMESSRSSGVPFKDAAVWSIAPIRLLETIVPSLYGDPTMLRVTSYWGGLVFEKGYPFLLSIYVGAVPVLLGLCALGAKGRLAKALGALTGFFLLASLGPRGFLYTALYHGVPLLASLRYPSRFLIPASLCLSMLAALGLARFREELPRRRLGPGTRLLLGGAGLLAAVTAALAWFPPCREWLVGGGLGVAAHVGAAELGVITGKIQVELLRCTLLSAGAGVTVLALRRLRMGPALASLLALLAIGVDLVSANSHVNPVVPPAFYEATPPILKIVEDANPAKRVYSEPRPAGFAVMALSDSAWWGYYWDQLTGRVGTSLPHRVRMAYDKSTDLLSPRRVNELADQMRDLDAKSLRRLAEIAEVGTLATYRELNDPGLIPAGQVARQTNVPLRFYRTRDPLPRAFLVARARPERGKALEALTRDDFDPRAEAYVEGIRSARGDPGAAGSARVVVDAPERLVVEVSAARPGWLIVTDNFYPGWIAQRDGTSLPIRRGNFLFRAVEVPAGESRIVLRYRPRSFLLGAAGSLIALGAGLGWAWAPRKKVPA
ncbi:MAG TPA: hypothetical protein VGR67_11275 [Candidatus Polarisedimenticolia bacterium]|nr:hypothetical protein [Candidatus Polarisedimenticolia bacterium]